MAQCIAIFCPDKEPATSQVKSLCDNKEIPHVMTGFSESGEPPEDSRSFSINAFPPPRAIGKVLADLVKHYGWTSLVILYEFSDGMQRNLPIILQSRRPHK